MAYAVGQRGLVVISKEIRDPLDAEPTRGRFGNGSGKARHKKGSVGIKEEARVQGSDSTGRREARPPS